MRIYIYIVQVYLGSSAARSYTISAWGMSVSDMHLFTTRAISILNDNE